MKIALFGCDTDSFQIIRWLAAHPQYELTATYSVGSFQTSITERFPKALISDEWEDALASADVDAMVVAGRSLPDTEQHADQLRKIMLAEIPLLVCHPLCEAILGLELEMIQRDTKLVIEPFYPLLGHPALDDLQRLTQQANEQAEPYEQLVIERTLADRSKQNVLRTVYQDAMPMRRIMGKVTHVGAMGIFQADNDFANLGVHMTGGTIAGRWSCGPVVDFCGVRLQLLGGSRRVVVSLETDEHGFARNGQFVLPDGQQKDYAEHDSIAVAFDNLRSRRGESSTCDRWEESCRALDVGDAIEMSCRRGRTMELMSEQPTEEGTFKTIMAASGCGLMMWILLMFVIYTIFLPDVGSFWHVAWMILIFAPLFVFLPLQFLKLLFKRSESDSHAS
ncbi:MAG: hypothetical protein R3C28_10325 [Pirellulaceae bacterium]